MINPQAIIKRLLTDTHLQGILKGAFFAFTLRIAGAATTFAFSVAVARTMGATGLGYFYIALSVSTILAVIGRVGLDAIVLRHTSVFVARDDWNSISNVYHKTLLLTFTTTLLLASIVAFFSKELADFLAGTEEARIGITLLAWSAIPFAIYMLQGQFLIGIGRIAAGVAAISVVSPLASLIGIMIFGSSGNITVAYYSSLAGALSAMIFASTLFYAYSPNTRHRRNAPPNLRNLLEDSRHMLWVSIFQLFNVWAPTLILGYWASPSEVGIYSAISRLILLANFVLVAVNASSSPKFAVLHKNGDSTGLQNVAQAATKLVIVVALPILGITCLFPTNILSVFGQEFKTGTTALLILAAGQFVNMITGPAGNVMMMCGQETLVKKNLAISSVVGVLLCLALVPNYGVIGAVIATATALSLENILMLVGAKQKLGIIVFPWAQGRRT